MSYKVLYRKYRPSNFETIIGQDYIVKTLRNSIKNQNISHAYIFSGPRGTGKTSTAKIFAKAINCLNPINGSPCEECEFCKCFNENPDIIEMDAASNNGVDDIRNIIDNIKLSPNNSKYKIYIIDEVHMLTVNAFNALLLTLEEPPKHVVFIMATTNIENVPITILSRAQRFDFQKISTMDISKALTNICEKENINIEEEAINEISSLADGGLRDALSILDQLSKNEEKITLDLIENEIRTVSTKTIEELLKNFEDMKYDNFINIVNSISNRGMDYKQFVKKTINIISEKILDIRNARLKNININDYKNIVNELINSINNINVSVNPYTVFKLTFLGYFKQNINLDDTNKTKENSNTTNFVENNYELNNLKDVRINNCFANASKECKELMKSKIEDIVNNNGIDGNVKRILSDSALCAASETNIIMSLDNKHEVESANLQIKKFDNIFENEIKFVFLTTNEWNIEKEKYITNIKNGVKYILKPDLFDEEKINISNVFDSSMVEIV